MTLLAAILRARRRTGPCKCGHPRQAHEHYRPGTSCSLCGCKRYRPTRKPPAGADAPAPQREPPHPRPPGHHRDGVFIPGADIAFVNWGRACGCRRFIDYQRGRTTGHQCTSHPDFAQWAKELQT